MPSRTSGSGWGAWPQAISALQQHDGSVKVIALWLKSPELTHDAAKAALRLVVRAMPELRPGATPGVLDVRRARLHTLSRRRGRVLLEHPGDHDVERGAGLVLVPDPLPRPQRVAGGGVLDEQTLDPGRGIVLQPAAAGRYDLYYSNVS